LPKNWFQQRRKSLVAKSQKTAPTSNYRVRRSFAKIPDVMDVPNLIGIQIDSFKWFMTEGLSQAFADISPIENSTKDMCVEFGDHEFGEPKYTVEECKEKDVSYQAPLFVMIPDWGRIPSSEPLLMMK
jgi:DNA-directed RNA polymerase subunit beta